jgi:hypothetical protein
MERNLFSKPRALRAGIVVLGSVGMSIAGGWYAAAQEIAPDQQPAAQVSFAAAKNGYVEAVGNRQNICERDELGRILDKGIADKSLPAAEGIKARLDQACPNTGVPHDRIAEIAAARSGMVLETQAKLGDKRAESSKKDTDVTAGMLGGALLGFVVTGGMVVGSQRLHNWWQLKRTVNDLVREAYESYRDFRAQ